LKVLSAEHHQAGLLPAEHCADAIEPHAWTLLKRILDRAGHDVPEALGNGRCRRFPHKWDRMLAHSFKAAHPRWQYKRLARRAPEVAITRNGLGSDKGKNLVPEVSVVSLESLKVTLIQQVQHKEIIALADDLVGDRTGLLGDEDAAQ